MQYKVVGDEFVELPIRTVDTGYGIDRFAWISQGVPSAIPSNLRQNGRQNLRYGRYNQR